MKKLFAAAAAAVTAISVAAFSGCDVLESILGHVHDMSYIAAKEATCTEGGNIEYYHCSGCGQDFADEAGTERLRSVVTKALGHDLEYVEPVAPTCTADGANGYYSCLRCEGRFIDEAGETAATDEEIVRPAEGHECDENEWRGDGRGHWNVCDVCGAQVNFAVHTYGEGGACTVCGYEAGEDDIIVGNAEDISSAELSIHFIAPQVKASGDSALIKVGDTEILVDAGPNKGNTQTIKKYIDKYCADGVLEYVIVTHADNDHILGMIGNKSGGKYNGILYSYNIETIIMFDRTNKTLLTENGNPTDYSDFLDAVNYAKAQGAAVYTGLQCYNNDNGASRTYYLNDEETVSLNILYNYYYDHESNDENNYSVCFLLTHETENGKENNYLFTGDLEEKGEEYLVANNKLPEVELYKAGHHGSKTSSQNVLLEVIKPKNIAVCCCAGYNQYGSSEENTFPTQAFIDRAGMFTDNIYVTITYDEISGDPVAMNGDIVFYYDRAEGEEIGSLKLWCSDNTLKLKDTDWFKQNRTWPQGGV